MSHNRKLGVFGGNEKLLQAVIENNKPLDLTSGDEEAQREAKRQEEASMATRGKEKGQADHMWVDRMLSDLYDRRGIRPYTGKRNAKRKGTIQNKQERYTINRISR